MSDFSASSCAYGGWALAVLVSVSMLLLGAGAFALSLGSEGETVALAKGLTTAVFTQAGVFSLLWGVTH